MSVCRDWQTGRLQEAVRLLRQLVGKKLKLEGFFLDCMVSECLDQTCDVPGVPACLLSGSNGNYLMMALTNTGSISLRGGC